MIPAVVFPYESTSAFGVARSLSLVRVPVIGLNHRKSYISLSNKFKPVICPDPIKSAKGFVDFLIKLGEKNEKSVIFGTIDIAAFIILQNESRLAKYYYYPYLDRKIIDVAFNKWTMFKVASQLEIPLPYTFMPTTPDEVKENIGHFSFPAIIKPLSGFVVKDGRAMKTQEFSDTYNWAKVLRAQNSDELLRLSKDALSRGFEILIQEEIPGGCDSLYETKFYVNQKGEIGHIFAARKIRQLPADFGVCSFGEAVNCGEIQAYTERFLRATGYKGIGEVEFKYDSRDKKFKFIEFNPRPTHWITLPTFCGHNFPLMQYEDFAGKAKRNSRITKNRTKWFDLKREIYYWAEYGLNPASPYHISFLRQIKSLCSGHITEVFLSLDDPVLAIGHLCICLDAFIRKVVKHFIFKLTGVAISRRKR